MEMVKKLALMCWAFRVMALAIAVLYGGAGLEWIALETANAITCGCVSALVSRKLDAGPPG